MTGSPYQAGDLVHLTAQFTDPASGNPVDPSTVTLQVWTPTATTTYTYGTGNEIARTATGSYAADVDTTGSTGLLSQWTYEWTSTGTGQAAQVGRFLVRGVEANPSAGSPAGLSLAAEIAAETARAVAAEAALAAEISSGGAVASVNGHTGAVVLGAADVGAATTAALASEASTARGAESTALSAATAAAAAAAAITASSLGVAAPTILVPKPTGLTATDTPAVQAAIAQLVSAGRGVLQFQDGTYQVDSNALVIRSLSNFAVRGTGGTVIAQAPNRTGLVNNTSGDLMVIADCTDFDVADVVFDGLRDTVAPMTPLTASAASGQPSVTVAAGQGARYLVGQRLFLFGGCGSSEQNQSEGFATAGAVAPLVIQSITPGAGAGGGDRVTFTTNLGSSYGQVSSTVLSDGFGPYAYAGAYLTPYQVGTATVAGRALFGEDQQNGLHLLSCQRFTVRRVTARNLWESPIRLGSGYEATSLTDACKQGLITECVGYHAYDQGVAVWASQNITVTDCVMTATGWAGVCFTGSDHCIAKGNQVVSPIYRVPMDAASGSGVVAEGGLRNEILGNEIVNPYQYGVEVIHSPLNWGIGGTLPTLSAYTTAGTAAGTSVQVSSTAGLQVGGLYSILDGQNTEAVRVASIVDSTHLTFSDKVSFSHAAGKPIGVRVGQENVVAGNTIRGAGSQGILLNPSVRTVVKDNTVTGGGSQGIALSYLIGYVPSAAYPCGDGSHLEGNIIGNGGGAAILANGCTRITVRGNTVYSPNSNGGGIELHGVTDSIVSENRVTDVIGSFGIVVENGGAANTPCARLVITGNVVERIGDLPGINVQTGDSLTIDNNVVRSCAGTAGMYLQGITRSTISGNVCNSNSGAGIRLDDNGSTYSLYNRVIGNTCRDDATGLEISYGGNAWTQAYGIVEAGSSDYNTFIGNECDANSTGQLTVIGSHSSRLTNTVSGAIVDLPSSGGGTAGMTRVATTGTTGYTLTNGTGTILTWTAPNDGLLHSVLIVASINVGGTAETGGMVQDSITLPNGSTVQQTVFAANLGQYTAIIQNLGGTVGPGRVAALQQTSALTGGSATVWAEMWAY